MCAIAGTVHSKDTKRLEQMLRFLAHRGPDGQGLWQDNTGMVRLGHRRLSIIDLSSAGSQPMLSDDRSVAVVFNGEIYNYKELSADLKKKGYTFHSASDTEVLVHGYAEYGSDIFKKIDGMWAIGLYDSKKHKLFLSRDPSGIKPLYIYNSGIELVFASEIGALAEAVGATSLHIDHGSLQRFLYHGYVMGDATIYKEIREIPAATTITFCVSDISSPTSERIYRPTDHSQPQSLDQAVVEFARLFQTSVQKTLQADVPVGLFLSGGVDSALVGYHIKKAGANPKAFTIGFEHGSFDESATAARIARHFDFPHEILTVNGTEAANHIERILDSFGEPFADMSAIPTYFISELAHQRECKVILAGDGADELFGGYQTHYLPILVSWYKLMPRGFDGLLEWLTQSLPSDFRKLGRREQLTRFLYGARESFEHGHALWKRVFTDGEMNRLLSGPTCSTEERTEAAYFDSFFKDLAPYANPVDAVSKIDFMTFLPSSCLVKSDISAMQNSVEIRLPFLNKAIIDFAWDLPAKFKATPFHTKKILRKALAQSVPRDITQLPKRGFVPPLAFWLTSELKPAMLDLLSRERIDGFRFINYAYVQELVDEHLAQRVDNSKKIWALMSLSRFLSRNRDVAL